MPYGRETGGGGGGTIDTVARASAVAAVNDATAAEAAATQAATDAAAALAAVTAIGTLPPDNTADVTALQASQAAQDALIDGKASQVVVDTIVANITGDEFVASATKTGDEWTITYEDTVSGNQRTETISDPSGITGPDTVTAEEQAAIDAAVLVETARAEATEAQLQTEIDSLSTGKADQADQLAQDNRLDALETDSHVALTLHADSVAGGATLAGQELRLPPAATPATLDTVPTDASTQAVESGGVFTALALKEDKANLVTSIRGAAIAEGDKYASELAIRTLVDGMVTGQTVTPFGTTFATLPAIPPDASTTVRYRTVLTTDDIGTGTAAAPQYPKGEYHNVGASPAGWVFAAALGGNIIEGVLADFDDTTEKAIAKTWKAETLDERYHPMPLPATGATLNSGKVYYGRGGTYTLNAPAAGEETWLYVINFSNLKTEADPISVTGKYAFSADGTIFTGTISVSPNGRWHLFWDETLDNGTGAWRIHSNRTLTIPLNEADAGTLLTRNNNYLVTNNTEDPITFRVPASPSATINVRYDRNSTGPIVIEMEDTTATANVALNGVTAVRHTIDLVHSGSDLSIEGSTAGLWQIYGVADLPSMLHLPQSAPAFSYSDFVLLHHLPPHFSLQITNTSREFGRTISLDGTKTLQMKRSNFSASEAANATAFSVPPNGVATVSYDSDNVFVTIESTRDMGYFSSLSLLTAINSNALLTGHFADVLDRRLHWDANATEGVAPDNIDTTQANPPTGRWVDSIADIPFWAPDTEHEVGDTVQQNRLPDGLLRQYSWDDSVNNAGVATDGTSGAVWNAAEQARWIDLGSPEVGEVTSTILEYIELGFYSTGTNASSAVSVTFVDLEGNNYPASDFEVSGTLTQHTGGTEESVFDRTPFTGTINLGRNKSGRLRFYYVGSNPNGTDSIATGGSNNGTITGLVAFKVAGSNETITFSSVADVTPTPWTTLTERVADQIDSWEPKAFATGDRVVVSMPINADWIDNDGAIFGVNYIIEATTDRPDTIAVFDDVEADSGGWKLIGAFRISGNDFRTMSGSGTQAIALTDIRSNEVKQHTIPEGVTQSYFYSGNPAGIGLFDDLTGAVTPTVVDSTAGVLSREFSVTGPARMTFTKVGNSPQFTFVSNDASSVGLSIPADAVAGDFIRLADDGAGGLEAVRATLESIIRVHNYVAEANTAIAGQIIALGYDIDQCDFMVFNFLQDGTNNNDAVSGVRLNRSAFRVRGVARLQTFGSGYCHVRIDDVATGAVDFTDTGVNVNLHSVEFFKYA